MTVLHEGVPGFGAAGLFEEDGSYIFIPPPDSEPAQPNTEAGAVNWFNALGLEDGVPWNSVKNYVSAKPTEET